MEPRRWPLSIVWTIVVSVLTALVGLFALWAIYLWRGGNRRGTYVVSAVGVLWLFAIIGAGSSDPKPDAADKQATSQTTAGATTGTTTAPNTVSVTVSKPRPKPAAITGFGATRAAWASIREPDPHPKLIDGCCFLPKQDDGRDRYYAINYDDDDRVSMYSMAFGPTASAKEAELAVREDLPSDARVVARASKPGCAQIDFQSATLKEITGAGKVGVSFFSDTTGGPYRASSVASAFVMGGSATRFDC